ncbi:unnamed protein product, partial [Brassica oleracea var. botrytis]
ATFPIILRGGSSAPTEGMLNPLWRGFEVVMAGTSAEVPLPPDHEVRFPKIIFACLVNWPCATHSYF